MDIKLKNNKISKCILVFIMIVSVALMLLPLNNDISTLYDRRVKDFYGSYDFNKYIEDKYNKLLSMVDTEYIHEDQMEDGGALKREKNIDYIAVNNNTGKVVTNSNYTNIPDFKMNKKGYVQIEGKNYDFNIDIDLEEDKESGYFNQIVTSETKEEVNNSKEKDISVYMVLPKVPTESDFLSIIYKNSKLADTYIKCINAAAVCGLIIFIFAVVIYRKNKGREINKENIFYKLYSKVPIELKLLGVFFIAMVDANSSVYYFVHQEFEYDFIVKLNIRLLIGTILCKIIYLSIIYLTIENIKDGTIKKSSIIRNIGSAPIKLGKYLKEKLKVTMVAGKNISLIKNMLLVSVAVIIINIVVNGAIFILLEWAWLGNREVIIIIAIITNSISLIALVIYITSKLGYLNEIMEGVKKIKQGDINYKIELKGTDSFTILAENINDIGNGLDNAIEERMKSEKMKSELITNVSHDLKTPLTSILNYVDLLKQEDVKPEHLNDYIAILDQKSKRLKVLIEDLFEAAKATSGTVELNIEKIQLNQLLTQSIAEMEGKVLEANLDMKVNFPENKVYINADGKKLFRVFENLISNIVKYSLKGTRVYIDLVIDEKYSYITFKNISAYELNFDDDEITERFKRGDASRHAEGSGLGLSIAKGLVEIQGGEFIIQTDGDLFKAIVKLELSVE